jgi:hypothetical protein
VVPGGGFPVGSQRSGLARPLHLRLPMSPERRRAKTLEINIHDVRNALSSLLANLWFAREGLDELGRLQLVPAPGQVRPAGSPEPTTIQEVLDSVDDAVTAGARLREMLCENQDVWHAEIAAQGARS